MALNNKPGIQWLVFTAILRYLKPNELYSHFDNDDDGDYEGE